MKIASTNHPYTFVFFGCSWTYGKFINLEAGQNPYKINLKEEAILADEKSYRGLIAKHFNARSVNFSQGGSSNDRQFRLAGEYFIGPKRGNSLILKNRIDTYKKLRGPDWPTVDEFSKSQCLPDWVVDEIFEHLSNNDFEMYRNTDSSKYILWFLTSSARKEFYNASKRVYENEMLNSPESDLAKHYISGYYDHDSEMEFMSRQMVLWNEYFASRGIKNLWIDTFNHYNYPVVIKNKINFGTKYSDIMSNLCVKHGHQIEETELHLGAWAADDSRSKYLQDIGLLNSTTTHPTIQGHHHIAEMLIPLVEQHFNLKGDL